MFKARVFLQIVFKINLPHQVFQHLRKRMPHHQETLKTKIRLHQEQLLKAILKFLPKIFNRQPQLIVSLQHLQQINLHKLCHLQMSEAFSNQNQI